ncbi:hypothetical protein [Boseongicola aestuarii]|jgi:hypothetical protein|uniref:Cytochrome c domain-containing protein n=1 Tax=Boseongicola aestuarii TaxID=1470561 RepID=A0A238IYP0_9RHOB|nr:hypothetical protein [Boseongicola aestuarii]SMX23598.1 hypothetical protein BOA8489_01708 [Boseongicola aestuarii]
MLKLLTVILVLVASSASAQTKEITLSAPDELVADGFLKYILPRFSLKTGVRINLSSSPAELEIGESGTPVFRREDKVYFVSKVDGPHADTFLNWMASDIGKRTIDGFKPEGGPIYSSDVGVQTEEEEVVLTGDIKLGAEVSLGKCGRCHVVSDENRMDAIGSTPSFALMRNFADWQERFQAFYVLKPHGAFTQVKDVTAPFPEHLPSPIAPIEVTLDEIDAITAFVGSIEAADLGAPLNTK